MDLVRPCILGASIVLISGCFVAAGSRGHSVETVPIGSCNPTPCAKVTIETLPELPPSFSVEARGNVLRAVDQALYIPLEEGNREFTRAGLIKSVEDQFDEFMREKDPEVIVDWSVARTASLVYSSGEFASVAIANRGFLGGAHGFDEERLFVFDAKTGNALEWNDVISADSRAIFLKAAEAEFKRARGISQNSSLTEAGFTFDKDDSFSLPLNFALTDKGILCHYNPYEVGPYVMGSTEFTVPMDVVRPSLTAHAASLLGVPEAPKGLL
jgi:hypothetical protein